MSTTDDRCIFAEELADSIAFKILLSFMTAVCSLGILAELISMKCTTLRMAVHANTKILILVHQVALILHCAAGIHAHVSDLYLYSQNDTNPCDYMSSQVRCMILRTPVTFTFFWNACAVGGIAVERTIATFFSSKYERMGRGLAVVIVVTELSVVSLLLFYVMSGQHISTSTKLVYCSTLNGGNVGRGIAILSVQFVIDITAALLLPILLFVNKKSRLNEVHANLSHRYQMNENIASIRTLLPLVMFHSSVYVLFITALLIYFATQQSWSQKAFAFFLESVQLTPVYALLLPLMLSYTQKRVQKRSQKTLNSMMNFSKADATKMHFQTVFNATPKRLRKC